MPRAFDCCIFFNELDMLYLRMATLESVVDCFVVCEANETHSGQPKEYIFEKNSHLFSKWADKIVYVQVDGLTGAGRNSWEREHYHRSMIATGLATYARREDFIIVSDCDEIVSPIAIADVMQYGKSRAKFELDFYYYNVNHRVQQGWAVGGCCWGLEQDPNTIRSKFEPLPPSDIYTPGGWHFSYFGGADAILEKHAAFMHHADPVIKDMPRDRVWIDSIIAANKDLYDRELVISPVATADSLPPFLLSNLDHYIQLGWANDSI